MATKYVSVTKAFWDESPSEWRRSDIRGTTMTVMATDPYERDTGLLDKRGNRIVALEAPNPIGFARPVGEE